MTEPMDADMDVDMEARYRYHGVSVPVSSHIAVERYCNPVVGVGTSLLLHIRVAAGLAAVAECRRSLHRFQLRLTWRSLERGRLLSGQPFAMLKLKVVAAKYRPFATDWTPDVRDALDRFLQPS